MAAGTALALDIGGTKITGAVVDVDGRVLRAARAATPDEGGNVLTERVLALAGRLATGSPRPLVGVGASVAGAVAPDGNTVTFAPNLPGWDGLPLGDLLTAGLNLPAYVTYDVDAGALGEHWRGAGRGADGMAFVIVGTGVGGGLILDGGLRRGVHGLAGAVGWMVVDRAGTATSEARTHGALEAAAAGPAIAAAARRAGLTDAATAYDVANAAGHGDPAARAVITRAAERVAHAVVGIVSLLDLDVIVLGGGVGGGIQVFVEIAREAVEMLAQPTIRGDVRVVPAELGDDAFLVGAARPVLEPGTAD